MKAREQYTDHEIRIRMIENVIIKIEEKFNKIDQKFDHLEQKIDSRFMWTIGLIFASLLTNIAMFATIALHAAKLI